MCVLKWTPVHSALFVSLFMSNDDHGLNVSLACRCTVWAVAQNICQDFGWSPHPSFCETLERFLVLRGWASLRTHQNPRGANRRRCCHIPSGRGKVQEETGRSLCEFQTTLTINWREIREKILSPKQQYGNRVWFSLWQNVTNITKQTPTAKTSNSRMF